MPIENVNSQEQPSERPLGTSLDRAADEISAAAKILSELQWTISTLLEKLHHPDLAAEVQMLQDIDRLHQTYVDLAAMIKVSAQHTQHLTIQDDDLKKVMKLDSLKQRVFGSEDSQDALEEQEITWF
ncbi:MAG: hypothetical protein ACRBCL_11135 [Maritimibacter sp.]